MKFIAIIALVAIILPLNGVADNKTAEAKTITFTAVCADTDTVFTALREQYHEVPVIAGRSVDKSKSIVTTWGNPETKTWTITATNGNVSCILSAGEKIEVLVGGTAV